jgi:hypothetical protein
MRIFLIVISTLVAFGCQNPPPEPTFEEKIINAIQDELDIIFNEPDTTGYGEIFWASSLNDNYHLAKVKAKSIIDRELNVLPMVVKEDEISFNAKYHYSHYEWETPQIKVNLEISNEFDGRIRFWILNK